MPSQPLPYVFPVLRHLGFSGCVAFRGFRDHDGLEAAAKKRFDEDFGATDSGLHGLPARLVEFIDLRPERIFSWRKRQYETKRKFVRRKPVPGVSADRKCV